MRAAELIMALIMGACSIALMAKSAELPIGWIRGEGPGGGAFPFWLAAGMLVCVVLGYLAGWCLRLPRTSLGTLVQGAYRGNLAYVGLPVVLFSLNAGGSVSSEMETLAVLVIAPLIPLYNIVAVAVLQAGQHTPESTARARLRRVLVHSATNPLVLACVAGIAFSLTGWTLPRVVARTCAALGQMAMPLALLGIGAALSFKALRGHWVPALTGALIKVLAAPLTGFLLGRYLGLPTHELRTVMLYLACPTAVVSFVMAEQLGGDRSLAAGIVVLSVLLAVPVIGSILLIIV